MENPVQAHTSSPDADQLARLLDLELIQKRATWKQTTRRRQSLRSFAFLFLFLLIAGCVAGFFFVFTRVSERRPNPAPSSAIDR